MVCTSFALRYMEATLIFYIVVKCMDAGLHKITEGSKKPGEYGSYSMDFI